MKNMMKYIYLAILILFMTPMICNAQATARCQVSATIINIADTADYFLEVEKNISKDTISINIGDYKKYLKSTFELPDSKQVMSLDKNKELWTYGNLIIYLINDTVSFIRHKK